MTHVTGALENTQVRCTLFFILFFTVYDLMSYLEPCPQHHVVFILFRGPDHFLQASLIGVVRFIDACGNVQASLKNANFLAKSFQRKLARKLRFTMLLPHVVTTFPAPLPSLFL